MLIFAGITTHTPLLLPQIARDKADIVDGSKQALVELSEDLYASHPDMLILVSPYNGVFADAFAANAHDKLSADLSEFGDLSTQKEWHGAPVFAANAALQARERKIPLRLLSEDRIDYGNSVPLLYLTEQMPDLKILPIGPSMLDRAMHFKLGEMIADLAHESQRRIAIVVAGHLSHCLTTASPEGYNPLGGEFDQALITALEGRNTSALLNLDEHMRSEARESIYHSLLLLLGAIKGHPYDFKTYCYEKPLGVGYLTGNFNI